MKPVFIAMLIILFVCSGCSVSSQNSTLAANELFKDDFSSSNKGWGIWKYDDTAEINYDQDHGGLRIYVEKPQYDFWSVTGNQFGDVIIETDATLLGGPVDNDFGIVCRYVDANNFYMLVVSSDGYYGIAKMQNGQYSMISSDQLQYSEYVAQGHAANHLRADCVGSTLTLYANNQKLVEIQDESFTSGDVGLLAGTYDEGAVDILFDNFVVKKP